MNPSETTHEILREIRDAVRATNGRVDQTNTLLEATREDLGGRIDQTNARLEATRDALGKRITESEVRTATAITGVIGAINGVKELLADRLDVRDRVATCERDIAWLRARIGEP